MKCKCSCQTKFKPTISYRQTCRSVLVTPKYASCVAPAPASFRQERFNCPIKCIKGRASLPLEHDALVLSCPACLCHASLAFVRPCNVVTWHWVRDLSLHLSTMKLKRPLMPSRLRHPKHCNCDGEKAIGCFLQQELPLIPATRTLAVSTICIPTNGPM